MVTSKPRRWSVRADVSNVCSSSRCPASDAGWLRSTPANEVARVFRSYGVDARRVMEIFCLDRKLNIAPAYLRPVYANPEITVYAAGAAP